jgi:hypothetical protein
MLWSPVGPIVGYWDPTKAWCHARTMLGVDVAQVEVREDLPEVVREDIHTEWDANDEDDTPRVEAVNIAFEDLDDNM